MVNHEVCRFEIWLVQLNPTKGFEINKTRPCIVISPNEMSSLKTLIVAPMTSKGSKFPTRIKCTFQEKEGLILLDQMRAIDKSRLLKKLGVIAEETQINIINCLQELFAL